MVSAILGVMWDSGFKTSFLKGSEALLMTLATVSTSLAFISPTSTFFIICFLALVSRPLVLLITSVEVPMGTSSLCRNSHASMSSCTLLWRIPNLLASSTFVSIPKSSLVRQISWMAFSLSTSVKSFRCRFSIRDSNSTLSCSISLIRQGTCFKPAIWAARHRLSPATIW